MKAAKLVCAVAAIALFGLTMASPAGAATAKSGDAPKPADATKSSDAVLRIGWALEPSTLNPFVGLDDEDYTIWAINWDLLVNFSPKDLSPAPGIAKSWDVSPDKKAVTFHLDPKAKWSDGVPVTSADVKYSLETLGGHGALFTTYTDSIASIETPDKETVVVKTSRPDTRIIDGMLVYIIPKHIWGKHSIDELTGSYQPDLPLVGTGPFILTDVDRGRSMTMERNPEFRGPAPHYERIEFIKYGNQDAVERALQVGEIDLDLGVAVGSFDRLGDKPDIKTVKAAGTSFTELSFNVCPPRLCPEAERNPAIRDQAVRQAVAYAVDRERINEIAARGTSFVANGIIPSYYKSFYEKPDLDYQYDPEKAEQILDDAGWTSDGDGPRQKGDQELKFNLYVRTESTYDIQAAKLVAEEAKKVGIEFDVQVVSTDKLTELTTQTSNGKPAPDFDTFIWDWVGDPYDPSFLLSILTTDEIGGSSDSFFSNAEYDRLYKEQAGEFDTAKRKEIIKRMVAITQEELPYLVLSYNPNLQAYRTDRIADVKRVCPEDDRGDTICEQTTYAPLLSIKPGGGSGGGGVGGTAIALIGVALLGLIGVVLFRARRRREAEPLEIEE